MKSVPLNLFSFKYIRNSYGHLTEESVANFTRSSMLQTILGIKFDWEKQVITANREHTLLFTDHENQISLVNQNTINLIKRLFDT
jgi:hypothetical protein